MTEENRQEQSAESIENEGEQLKNNTANALKGTKNAINNGKKFHKNSKTSGKNNAMGHNRPEKTQGTNESLKKGGSGGANLGSKNSNGSNSTIGTSGKNGGSIPSGDRSSKGTTNWGASGANTNKGKQTARVTEQVANTTKKVGSTAIKAGSQIAGKAIQSLMALGSSAAAVVIAIIMALLLIVCIFISTGVITNSADRSGLPDMISDEMLTAVIETRDEYNVPASVSLAQIIQESSGKYDGLSLLASKYFNLFGIKGTGTAGSVNLSTGEESNGQNITISAGFRVYYNHTESVVDHAQVLSKPLYTNLTQGIDWRTAEGANSFAQAIGTIYATDSSYSNSLITLMEKYNLYRYDSADVDESGSLALTGGDADTGVRAAAYAKTKVGMTYSQANRWSETSFDCSSLVYRAYNETGYAAFGKENSIASEEARWCVDNNKSFGFTSESELLPGDVIFYGGENNNRYLGIYHVAIYYGDGMQVEAYNPNKGVIYTTFRKSNINLYGRPWASVE